MAKTNSASDSDIRKVIESAERINTRATVTQGASPVFLSDSEAVRGKKVLVIEDGPTITHGGMAYGAGLVAAKQAGAAEIIDPRKAAKGDYAEIYAKYPHIGTVLPALGYFPSQLLALRDTINAADVDVVIDASPCDLSQLVDVNKPMVQVSYEFEEVGEPGLSSLVDGFLHDQGLTT